MCDVLLWVAVLCGVSVCYVWCVGYVDAYC